MRAYIRLWGNEYPVHSVTWNHLSRGVLHVTFADEKEEHHTIFHHEGIDAERQDKIKHADLEKVVFWAKK